ncbi:MAG: hypothetical protein QM784_05900 [Polyangiaceae bacterium]
MNDRRVAVIREALLTLLDSLDAVSRVSRWDAMDPIPESLESSAKQLEARLEKANALTATSYVGSALVVSQLNGISDAIRRLDRAYIAFRERVTEHPDETEAALETMRFDVDEVKDAARQWG